MRVLYVSNSRMPTEKAHGLQIAKTIESFFKCGAKVVLLIPNRKNHIKESIKEFYDLSVDIEIKRSPDIFSFLQNMSEKIYFPIQRLSFGIYAFLFCLFFKTDVVYSRDITLSFFLSIFGKKVVYEDHEPKRSFKRIYQFFVKKIPIKVVVASNLVNLYESLGVKKSTYIFAPNGVDIEEFSKISRDKKIWNKKLGLNSEDKIVLYVGHFYRWKGVYTLIDAAKNINSKVVLIGGTDVDNKDIIKYIENSGLKNVFVLPFVKHKEIIKFIKSADVLVLPNTGKEERSQKYTTPVKLFEYMASGVPIVASNVKSFDCYLKDKINAFLFKADNPDDLASGVNCILKDKNIALKIALKASSESIEYDWSKRARKIIQFIS